MILSAWRCGSVQRSDDGSRYSMGRDSVTSKRRRDVVLPTIAGMEAGEMNRAVHNAIVQNHGHYRALASAASGRDDA
jgi:hypothetical protein